MKKFIFVVVLTFALAISGKAFAAQSIALTGTLPAVQKGAGATAAIPAQATNPAPAQVNNDIRAAQSIALTGTLPAVQKGAGATAAIPAQSIALTGTLPAGVQGLTASDGNNGVGVAVLEGLGYLFTVKLLTLHF